MEKRERKIGHPFAGMIPLISIILVFLLHPLPGMGQTIAQGNFDALQQHLQGLGWRVERSEKGDLLLWPTSGQAVVEIQPAEPAVQADEDRIVTSNFDQMKTLLEERGWKVEKDESGSLLLYPSRQRPVAAAQVVAAESKGDDRFNDLQVLLSASGWQVDRDESGHLLLRPRPPETTTEAKQATVYGEIFQLVKASDALTAAGWKVQEKADGSLVLFPQDAQPVARAETTGSAGSGDPVSTGQVALPVDSWKEARAIADYWLEQQAGEAHTLGRIRKINWVYLVSIVDKSPPHNLINQIAIRSQDGQVVALY